MWVGARGGVVLWVMLGECVIIHVRVCCCGVSGVGGICVFGWVESLFGGLGGVGCPFFGDFM